MFKKTIASFAVGIYFAFVCGVIVNYHYCMDQYYSFSLYKQASDKCPQCGMHTKGRGCCHDEIKIVKLQDDHQTSSVDFSFKNLQPAVITLADFKTPEINNDRIVHFLNHSPPLLNKQDTYLQNRVFRI